uniref:ATP synthase complex subunit 8 n=2 Tax=Nothoprocta TaxID=8806 RepID=A0A7G9TWQ6_9AVES|nr:ATP synthase F0 subunit 8 [Nothoprocta ornata]YP_009991938.1 ATP synthase F0 subunit 8 [Nothoprocta pentlandii]QNN84799.1 ATP synthase F0 subunit 8 [Nothoprocta ornata]QNN84812.1 ATP synthase F0 subunit 8 [Nothoprocta pentlandii]
MPQLNPGPWFLIMVLSWLIFLFILQPKSLSFMSSNSPSNKTNPTFQSSPWLWPWT